MVVSCVSTTHREEASDIVPRSREGYIAELMWWESPLPFHPLLDIFRAPSQSDLGFFLTCPFLPPLLYDNKIVPLMLAISAAQLSTWTQSCIGVVHSEVHTSDKLLIMRYLIQGEHGKYVL